MLRTMVHDMHMKDGRAWLSRVYTIANVHEVDTTLRVVALALSYFPMNYIQVFSGLIIYTTFVLFQ